MELTKNLRRESVDRHHTATTRLDRKGAEEGGMLRAHRVFLYGIEHRGSLLSGIYGQGNGKERKQQDRYVGRLAQFFQTATLTHEAGVLTDQTKDQADDQQEISGVSDVPSRHIAVDG